MSPAELLERTAGLQWSSSLERLATPRLHELAAPHGSVDSMMRAASARPALAAEVAAAFTIGETWFYRFGEQLDAVARALAGQGRVFRLWSAGCSSGEEALALQGACRHAGVTAQVLGTDLNDRAIQTARQGVYATRTARDAPPDRTRRIFRSQGGLLHVRPDVRSSVHYQVHNLLDHAPQGRFDVVACRNVLIYLTPAATARVFERLAAALVPGGYLLLAPSDPRPPAHLGFEHVQLSGTRLLRRSPATETPDVRTPPTPAPPLPAATPLALAQARREAFDAPGDPQTHLRLGWAFLHEGLLDRAGRSLYSAEACLAGAPDSWTHAHLQAQCAQLRHQLRGAGVDT